MLALNFNLLMPMGVFMSNTSKEKGKKTREIGLVYLMLTYIPNTSKI